MIAGIVILFGYVALIWLIFFQLKWLIAWAVVSALVGLHLLLIFVIGLRFVTPYSTDARVTAFREVENALANEQLLARRLPSQVGAVESRTDAVRIATMQYIASARAEMSPEGLAKMTQNPVANLISVPFQLAAYYNAARTDDGPSWQLRFQVQLLFPK